MGLALAEKLGRLGHQTHVFEQAPQLGGLTTWHDFGRFVWDRFYHVILPTDAHLIGLIRDVGLEDRLRWQVTQTGFFVDRRFHPLNNNVDFLRFPPLSLWSKFRLAMTILYCARIDDWRRLERMPLEDWLIRHSGSQTYNKIWKPLLLAKLGKEYKRVSAVFIWAYIKRMFSARDTSAAKESLGHLSGCYRTLFDRLQQRIAERGGSVTFPISVSKISSLPDRRIQIETEEGEHVFDKVVFTGPVNALRAAADEGMLDYSPARGDVEYLGVLCAVIVTRKPLMPYYILNIADERVPFTGVIGMSNVADPAETAGLHVNYLPKYLLSTDPEFDDTDDEILGRFRHGIDILFPDLAEADIESIHLNRARKVQPLQVIGYSDLIPKVETRHPNFYVLNTAQFVNNTLNNNEVVRNVNAFMERFSGDFAQVEGGAR